MSFFDGSAEAVDGAGGVDFGAFGCVLHFANSSSHAGPEIMLSKYAQVVTDEMHDVQVRWFESCGLGVGQNLLAENARSMQSNEP